MDAGAMARGNITPLAVIRFWLPGLALCSAQISPGLLWKLLLAHPLIQLAALFLSSATIRLPESWRSCCVQISQNAVYTVRAAGTTLCLRNRRNAEHSEPETGTSHSRSNRESTRSFVQSKLLLPINSTPSIQTLKDFWD
ncbi:unnamed protein product [Arctogadus glacialis]